MSHYEHVLSTFLEKVPGNGSAKSEGLHVLNILKQPIGFQNRCASGHPPSNVWEFSFPSTCLRAWYYTIFKIMSVWWVTVSPYFISVTVGEVEHLFICLLTIYISFSGKSLFISFGYELIFLYWYIGAHCVFWILIFYLCIPYCLYFILSLHFLWNLLFHMFKTLWKSNCQSYVLWLGILSLTLKS